MASKTPVDISMNRDAMYKLLCMYIHVKGGENVGSIKCVADSIRLGGEINEFVETQIENARTAVTKFIQSISEPVQKRKYVHRNLSPELQKEEENTIRIYCEGACINIGTPGARASIGIFCQITTHDSVFTREVSELISESDAQSNQRAELCALYKGIQLSKELKDEFKNFDVQLVISSVYAHKCVTDWGQKWESEGWKGLIHHKDIIRPMIETLDTPCVVIKKSDAIPGFLRARSLVSQATNKIEVMPIKSYQRPSLDTHQSNPF